MATSTVAGLAFFTFMQPPAHRLYPWGDLFLDRVCLLTISTILSINISMTSMLMFMGS